MGGTIEIDDLIKEDVTSGEDTYDGLIGAELHMPGLDGSFTRDKVINRVKGNDGKCIGRYYDNPIIDTSEYEVVLEDGSSTQYAANVIAENIFSQADSEGNQYSIISEITDHKGDNSAIKISDGYI